jgi:hypothetical protein
MILPYLVWELWKNIKAHPLQMNNENQLAVPEKIIATTNAIGQEPIDPLRQKLTGLINELIHSDFNSLVQLLYRIDVDERKLKRLLKDSPHTDAAVLIAELIIQRQLQKIESRNKFNGQEKTDPDHGW